ncbi:MAG: hypothetical protein A3I01_11375 [Betaproteobacteria bacterium RIFCSPLOWO2_02_FULL_65_24]|nr:MAG: hypothetical protein A3I01_11375 [Betaproteobacteria bacterium RIFCSPLOWO2_02_FULL_65_24]
MNERFGPRDGDGRLPVALLTGFLGSGKTTLLNRLLRHPAMAKTAVVINEFGEIPLDQHFVEKSEGEVVVLANGCLCCSVQGDLEGVIGTLFASRRGNLPVFERMLIETSGLADPAPIMQMLLNQPLVIDNFSLDSVVATVDAVHGERQLREHEEAFKQAALADRVVFTKTDLCGPEQTRAIERRVAAINPAASLLHAAKDEISPARLFGGGRLDSLASAQQWLSHRAAASDHRHSVPVSCHTLTADRPLPWQALNLWLRALRIRHAERLLRVKGIANLQGEHAPVALHGVHHVFHPPVALPHLAGEVHGTRLVLITRDLPGEELEAGWRAFLAENGVSLSHL